jgi:hypothetical protein
VNKHELQHLERIFDHMAKTLADLDASIQALTAAVAAKPPPPPPQDFTNEVSQIDAATTALGGTPPAPPPTP